MQTTTRCSVEKELHEFIKELSLPGKELPLDQITPEHVQNEMVKLFARSNILKLAELYWQFMKGNDEVGYMSMINALKNTLEVLDDVEINLTKK